MARQAVTAFLALFLALGLGLVGASCVGSATAPPAPSAKARDVTLVLIKTGPQSGKLSEEENNKVFAGHFANMGRMAEAGQLLLAGPFTKVRHDDALRGIFVLDTGDRARAQQIAATDPPTQAGVFVQELHTLTTDAPLRAYHDRVLKLDAEAEAQAKAEGRVRQPGENARSYVLLTAEDGERSRRVLEPLARSGVVLLLARFDGTGSFAILDAADPDAAKAALGDVAGQLGPYVLDGWYASNELAKLPEMHD